MRAIAENIHICLGVLAVAFMLLLFHWFEQEYVYTDKWDKPTSTYTETYK